MSRLDAAANAVELYERRIPDPRRFRETVGTAYGAGRGGGHRVRAFGEMVALLWSDGNQAAAIRLEELWNELAETHSFASSAAYPIMLPG